MQAEIIYTIKDCYELQMIDANCNNCIFMERDMEKYKKWHDWHRALSLIEFYMEKGMAILNAWNVIDNGLTEHDKKSGGGMLRVALKMNFLFEKVGLLQYGTCKKFDKPVSFLPVTCQIETQHCFQHRKNSTDGRKV